jgi:hypothetical protein
MRNYSPSLKIKAQAELERRRRLKQISTNYQADPCAYADEILKVKWWGKQREIAQLLITPPYRVLVKASHSIGKTHLAGGLVNWFFDSFPNSITLTTAPSDRQVKDLLWKEVRSQRGNRGGFAGPKIPRLESSPSHFAHGYTARDDAAFQGHHTEHMLFIFDEAVGIDSVFWEATESMFGGEGHAWLCIFNPTDTSSQAYVEEESGKWHTVSVSMLEHPNIVAELNGDDAPFPSAIRVNRIEEMIASWCTPVLQGDEKATDICWSEQWFRPGPIAESRMLGRWPSQATSNVWSDAVWGSAVDANLEEDGPIEIGCDVARFGDDFTEMHVRRGPVSLHHEAHNGWATTQTAGRLKELAREWGQYASMTPQSVLIKVDDDGVGGGVVDQAEGFHFAPISAGSSAFEPEKYPNRRSELWFAVAERANEKQLDLSRIDPVIRNELRQQAMAPRWKQDSWGRRVVEKKDDTKRRIKRSPDGIDAMNLAYAPRPWLLD